jgi:hypothetical protein
LFSHKGTETPTAIHEICPTTFSLIKPAENFDKPIALLMTPALAHYNFCFDNARMGIFGQPVQTNRQISGIVPINLIVIYTNLSLHSAF